LIFGNPTSSGLRKGARGEGRGARGEGRGARVSLDYTGSHVHAAHISLRCKHLVMLSLRLHPGKGIPQNWRLVERRYN
jgi:hypothetical protein